MRVNLRGAIEVRFGSQRAFSRASGIEISHLNRIVKAWIDPTPIERERCVELLKADSEWLFKMFTIPAAAQKV